VKYSESVLCAHLTNADSLDILAREGFLNPQALEIIPTELIRDMVRWALDRFFESHRLVAPSKQAFIETWGDKMEALGVLIDDDTETDTVQWAISDLRSFALHLHASEWAQSFAEAIYTAEPEERVKVAQAQAQTLLGIIDTVRPRRDELTGLQGVDDAILRLKQRQTLGDSTVGLTFGMPLLDEHLFGVHPSEIAVVAGGPGTGKSWFAGYTLLNEFSLGRRSMLITLENDVFMTYDRLLCMAAGVDYERWQRGDVNELQTQLVEAFRETMSGSDAQPVILQLSPEDSTPGGIVRRAAMEGVKSTIVDQVSFVRPDRTTRSMKRNEELGSIMRTFAELIRHEYEMPLVLMTQINRDGVQAARKSGRFHKDFLAEGSWLEQSASIVLALFQSELMRSMERAQIQQLKSRRTGTKHFEGIWRPWLGDVRMLREVSLTEDAPEGEATT
jgi:replicative DNA helicase